MPPKRPPLRIGSVTVGFPVVLAAMSGYSDWPMRVLSRRLGAEYAVNEALLDRFVVDVTRGRKVQRLLRSGDEDRPCGAQLLGAVPEDVASAAVSLVAAGFDVIDLNFGCPVRKVLGRCRGGYLLSQPDLALKLFARVRDAVAPKVPVTVKMRRGTDDSSQSRENFFAIFDGVFRAGAAAVTVHARTVRQGYDGPSSWEFLRQVKQHAGSHTVLGSGDLFTAQHCLDLITQTGVDGVTVARGAIGNPWIFEQAKALFDGKPMPPPPTVRQQRRVIAEHHRLAEQVYGPSRCCRVLRKFGIQYARLHPRPRDVRGAFIAVRRPDDWHRVLATWYAEDAPGRYPGSVTPELQEG